MNSTGQSNRRVLVLGAVPPTCWVTAYTWDNLPKSLNVSDYDVVILNLDPFADKEFARRINVETLPSWQQFARLLFSEGSEVIAVGSPSLNIGNDSSYRSVIWWLPRFPKISFEHGEEIREVAPQFSYYFQHVRRWSFHTAPGVIDLLEEPARYLVPVSPEANYVGFAIRSLAQTRFQMSVAFELRFRALQVESQEEFTKIAESGPVIWLPPPTEISAAGAVNLILRERYGVIFEQVAPEWVQA